MVSHHQKSRFMNKIIQKLFLTCLFAGNEAPSEETRETLEKQVSNLMRPKILLTLSTLQTAVVQLKTQNGRLLCDECNCKQAKLKSIYTARLITDVFSTSVFHCVLYLCKYMYYINYTFWDNT